MIQRIQSLWLLISALTAVGLFLTDMYMVNSTITGTLIRLHVMEDYPSLVLASLILCLPLVALFSFRHRRRQKRLILVQVLCSLLLLVLTLFRSVRLQEAHAESSGAYGLGAMLPLLIILFSLMAWKGIRQDEKLLKSVDRFR